MPWSCPFHLSKFTRSCFWCLFFGADSVYNVLSTCDQQRTKKLSKKCRNLSQKCSFHFAHFSAASQRLRMWQEGSRRSMDMHQISIWQQKKIGWKETGKAVKQRFFHHALLTTNSAEDFLPEVHFLRYFPPRLLLLPPGLVVVYATKISM